MNNEMHLPNTTRRQNSRTDIRYQAAFRVKKYGFSTFPTEIILEIGLHLDEQKIQECLCLYYCNFANSFVCLFRVLRKYGIR